MKGVVGVNGWERRRRVLAGKGWDVDVVHIRQKFELSGASRAWISKHNSTVKAGECIVSCAGVVLLSVFVFPLIVVAVSRGTGVRRTCGY